MAHPCVQIMVIQSVMYLVWKLGRHWNRMPSGALRGKFSSSKESFISRKSVKWISPRWFAVTCGPSTESFMIQAQWWILNPCQRMLSSMRILQCPFIWAVSTPYECYIIFLQYTAQKIRFIYSFVQKSLTELGVKTVVPWLKPLYTFHMKGMELLLMHCMWFCTLRETCFI
jgi:hypothetical protein